MTFFWQFDQVAGGRLSYESLVRQVSDNTAGIESLEKSVEDINDLTTETNLLRGTKDFTQGTRKNGWHIVSGSVYEDIYGSAYANLSTSGNSSISGTRCTLQSNYFPMEAGHEYTLFFEMMVDDLSAYDVQNHVATVSLYTTDSVENWGYSSRLGSRDVTVDFSAAKSKQWFTVKYYFSATSESVKFGDVTFLVRQNGSINIRNACVYKGHVNNPVWSASPIDIDYISKGALAENIIRGTRDFAIGTKKPHVDSIASDGFVNRSNCGFTVDSEGFGNFYNAASTATNARLQFSEIDIDGLRSADYVTISMDVKLTGDNDLGTNSIVTFYGMDNSATTHQIITYGANDRAIMAYEGFEKANRESWVRIHKSFPLLKAGVDGSTYATGYIEQFSKNILIRKIAVNLGYIRKPEWRENPFDVAQADAYTIANGTYAGASIADKFAGEIGSQHIATWLQSRVKSGNFNGLNIGDYVTIQVGGKSVRYNIAAIDPYTSYASNENHHIAMVPNSLWTFTSDDADYQVNGYYIQWNTTADNNGTEETPNPYLASNLHKWETEVHLKRFPQEWQDAMADLSIVMEQRYSASAKLNESTGQYIAKLGKIWSLSEMEIYGSRVWGTEHFSASFDCHFPFFAKTAVRRRFGDQAWLRTVGGGDNYTACVMNGSSGNMTRQTANANAVRAIPCFYIG